MTTFLSLMGRRAKDSTGKTGLIGMNNNQTPDQVIDLQAGYMPYYRKFELVSEFVISMNDVLAISVRYYYGAPYVWFHAIKHILKNAFNEYPTPGIKFEKVLVSRGRLWNTQEAIAKAVPGAITFTWTNDAGIGGANPDDKCILVAYCQTLNKCVFTKDGGERHSENASLMVPEFRSHKVHTWLGFISADGMRISNSAYAGEILVT